MGVELEMGLVIFLLSRLYNCRISRNLPFYSNCCYYFFVLKNYITHHFFKRGRRKRRVLTGNCLNMNSFSSFLSSDGNETSWNSDENTTENSQVQLQLFYLEKRTDSSLWDKNVKML